MKKTLLVLFITAICAQLVAAQHPNVLISSNQNPSEPAICIDLQNTNVIVAGANLNAAYY